MTNIFADGYESGGYTNFTGTLTSGGAPTITTSSPHAGTNASRHALNQPTAGNQEILEYKSISLPASNVLVVESWVCFRSGSNWGGGVATSRSVVRVADGGNAQMLSATVVGDKTLQLAVRKKDGSDVLVTGTIALTQDVWYLVRLILDRTGGSPIATLKVGTSVGTLAVVGTVTDATSGAAGLGGTVTYALWGISGHGSTNEASIYTVDIDDVSVDDTESTGGGATAAPNHTFMPRTFTRR